MANLLPKTLAFRHTFVSSVVKENTVTLFGEIGSEFQLGTDYDAEILYKVSSAELSNLVNYYNGGMLNSQAVLPNGSVGSLDLSSLLSVNAEVTETSIRPYETGYVRGSTTLLSEQNTKQAGGQYYLGDVVLFSPDSSIEPSCWTCIRTTSSPISPIPLRGTVAAGQINRDAVQGSTFQYAGFYGPDKNSQNYITGVKPAYYTYPGATSTNITLQQFPDATLVLNSEYWKESTIARLYSSSAIYYAGEVVTFSGGVYLCISTQGDSVTPSLFLNPTPGSSSATIELSKSLEALNGSYGVDFGGQRYIQNVPPAGGVNSGQFWKPGSYPRLPTTVYANINWTNFEVNQKINQYDANIAGGDGAQAIPSFTDDIGSRVVTLRKIYDDNEKSFIMDVATNILSRIPAAAIKAQLVGQRPTPDSSLGEMVMAGPHWTYPDNYAPAVQGVFEEAVYRDMLQVSGVPTTISDFIVSTGSEGYFQDGSTGSPSVELIQQIGGKSILATNPLSCTFDMNNRIYARCGISRIFVDKSMTSYAADTDRYATGDVVSFGGANFFQEQMFYIPPTAIVNGVDATTGKILSVTVTNPGDGILGLPTLTCNGKVLSYLVPFAKVTSLASAFQPANKKVNSWGFSNDSLVKVSQGSGSGATGIAKINLPNNNPSLTNEYDTDLTVSFDTTFTGVSRGTKYLGPPNNAYKQDLVMLTSATGGRIPAAVTKVDTQGGILEVELLKQGCGYLNAPIIQLGRPPINPLDTAKVYDEVSGATAGITLSEPGLLGITLPGRYSLKNTAGDTVLPQAYVAGLGSTYGGIDPYMGINYVDVVYGGLGFQSNEQLDVIGSVTPALFTSAYGSSGGTFLTSNAGGSTAISVNIINGGNGYRQDQHILLDGPTASTQLLGKITRLGGNATNLSFSSADLCGIDYEVGDLINLTNSVKPPSTIPADMLIAVVTDVDVGGQLYDAAQQSGAPTSLAYSNTVGGTFAYQITGGFTGATFNVQDQLSALPLYRTVQSINITRTGAVYTGTNPTIDITPATGDGAGVQGFTAVDATATPVLGLNGIGVTGTPGLGFVSGDFVFINQANGVGGAATPAKAVVLQVNATGAPLALGVEVSGQKFDVAEELQYSTNGDGTAFDGTTGGTTFNSMFRTFFTIIRIDMVNRGLGYTGNPTVTIAGTSSGVPQVCSAVTQPAGSGALFTLKEFDLSTDPITFTVKLIDRGTGYIQGDVLDFYGPVLSTVGFVQGHGVLALVDRTVGGNITAADFSNSSTAQGTLYSPGLYQYTMNTTHPNNPTPGADYPLRFRVLTVGDPSSISRINILYSRGAYNVNTQFSHKKLAKVSVKEVDSFGKILSLDYEPGYGYRGIPTVKAKKTSAGIGSLFNVPYMGVSRVENSFYKDSFLIENTLINPPIALLPATAYATIPGDLYPISVDLFKNPNILDTLESIKPGSTTGYAQGKATMSLQNMFVKNPGKSLGPLLSRFPGTTGARNLTINISPPDLSPEKGGVQAVAIVQSAGYDSTFQRILAVTVPDNGRGAGYLKQPVVTVSLSDGQTAEDMPILIPQMSVSGVQVTSRGLGFGNPPGAQISDSDVTPGLRATITSTTLKKTITQFDITNPGSQYTEIPNIDIISQGTGHLGYIRMAITDIQVVDSGAGFKVGDVLEFGHFGTTGLTLTAAGATGITYLFNSPPPSDNVYLKANFGGLTYQSTQCAQACVSEINPITGGIVNVVINYNPWSPSKDKYGLDTRVLSKNDIQSGGLGYGYSEYYEPNAGLTYIMETLPRVIGFYRPNEIGAAQYYNAGTTLATSGIVPWIDLTTGSLIKGATFLQGGSGVTFLEQLGLDLSGTTLLSDLYTAKSVRLPDIQMRLGVGKFDVYNDKEGDNHVNDAQILIESPPQVQQARYDAIRNPTTNSITSYAPQSTGLGYTKVPNILITGGSGSGANATAKMGIGEVKILDGGSGYEVGDIVTFPSPVSGIPATGVVTVVDGGILSVGRQAVLKFQNLTTSVDGLTFNNSTFQIDGGGATGSYQVFNKGFGYRLSQEILALPKQVTDTWAATYGTKFWVFPETRPGSGEVDAEMGYMYTYGDITSKHLYDQPLGTVFGIRPRSWVGVPSTGGNPAYAILMVNFIINQQGEGMGIYRYDGALVTVDSTFITQNPSQYPGFGRRTGLVTSTRFISYAASMPFGQNLREVYHLVSDIPPLKFMGWSDGDTSGPTRFAYDWWNNIAYGGEPEYLNIPKTPARFRVDALDLQANGVLDFSVVAPGTGSHYDAEYLLDGSQTGKINYINVLNKGSGYTSIPENSQITINKLDGSPSGSGAKLYPTLSLVELTATSGGNLYFSAPSVYIDPPLFRSLKPQLYARSAEILFQNSSNFDWESLDPAIDIITPGVGYVESGIYKLVVDRTSGGLHQEGNASFSIDTLLMLGGTGNLVDDADLDSGVDDKNTRYRITSSFTRGGVTSTLLQKSIYIVRGSNYRPNEIYNLIPYGRTPSLTHLTTPGVAATIKILKVSDYLNNDGTQIYGSGNNDYIGILDEGRLINGEDVGGYGTGYPDIPKFRIAGGNQGVVMAPSLGLTNIDFVVGNRGTNYNINDEVWAEAPEFGAVVVGKVAKVSDGEGGDVGTISQINLYTPYKTGLRSLPKLTVVRKGAIVPGSKDAELKGSLGLTQAAITANTDGFVGDAFVQVDFPQGAGYVVQPSQALVDPKYVFMVDQVAVNPNGNNSSPVLYEKAPIVKFDIPPFINTYSGWNGVYFAPGDAFEIVVQYTIAKAVAFQVDPDVTLPGKYLEADSITIGGISIPLRKPGAASSQGREISQNRVVYKYLVKFQAQ